MTHTLGCLALLLALLLSAARDVRATPPDTPPGPADAPASPARQAPLAPRDGRLGTPGDNRFGVIVTGLTWPETTTGRVSRLVRGVGATWWHDYSPLPLAVPGLRRAELVFSGRKWTNPGPADLQARARANPGAYWIMGNEPNLVEQDHVDPRTYAQQLHVFAERLHAVDPRSRIVGANPMNWDSTCTGCGGPMPSGHRWVSEFLDVYRALYHRPPPIDVWGVHCYDLNWDRTPMVNVAPLEADLVAMRAYLDGVTSERGKPIWVTEFGVVWGYDGYAVQRVGSETRVLPRGALRTDRIAAFLEQFGGWLAVEGAPLKIERWFVYATYGPPEPYTDVSAVLSLYSGPYPGSGRNQVGDAYLKLNGGVPPPRGARGGLPGGPLAR